MRRKLALVAMACAAMTVTGTALAQKAAAKQGKDMTYTGCVVQGKASGTYLLTHVMAGRPGVKPAAFHGTAPKMIELHSKNIPIAAQNGHKVVVMGRVKGKTHPMMKVTGLESLNGTCA